MLYNKCILCTAELKLTLSDVFDTRFGIKSSYSIAICPSCESMQTIQVPNADMLTALYEEYYNFGGEKGTAYTRIREWFLSSTLYRSWLSLDGDISFHGRRSAGLLLDIGCNEGRGLNIYRQNGFDPEGLELNEIAAREARDRGFTVYKELLEKFQPDRLYDIVVLSNVIEHSLDPRIMLNHVNRILKTGGQVWISCPNVDSWQRAFFGKYWINWHVPFHIVHFTAGTLGRLLSESGFEVQAVQQVSPSLWMAHSIIARLFVKPGQQTRQLRNPFLVAFLMLLIRCLLFPILWLGNRLGRGDCLVVVSQKVKDL